MRENVLLNPRWGCHGATCDATGQYEERNKLTDQYSPAPSTRLALKPPRRWSARQRGRTAAGERIARPRSSVRLCTDWHGRCLPSSHAPSLATARSSRSEGRRAEVAQRPLERLKHAYQVRTKGTRLTRGGARLSGGQKERDEGQEVTKCESRPCRARSTILALALSSRSRRSIILLTYSARRREGDAQGKMRKEVAFPRKSKTKG